MRNPDCIQTDMGGLAAEYMRDMFTVRASLASDSQYRGSEDHLKLIERMSRISDKNDVLRDEMSAAGGTVPSSLSTMPDPDIFDTTPRDGGAAAQSAPDEPVAADASADQ